MNSYPGLGNLMKLSDAQTRSVSAENVYGEKGNGGMATEGISASCARDLGLGWKISPAIAIISKLSSAVVQLEFGKIGQLGFR